MNITFTVPNLSQIPVDCYIAYFVITLLVLFMHWSYCFIHDVSFYGWKLAVSSILWPLTFVYFLFWFLFTEHQA